MYIFEQNIYEEIFQNSKEQLFVDCYKYRNVTIIYTNKEQLKKVAWILIKTVEYDFEIVYVLIQPSRATTGKLSSCYHYFPHLQ